jgi:hypothetical protein
MTEEFAPLTTPGCIIKTDTVSLAFRVQSRAHPHAGLIVINDEAFPRVRVRRAQGEAEGPAPTRRCRSSHCGPAWVALRLVEKTRASAQRAEDAG